MQSGTTRFDSTKKEFDCALFLFEKKPILMIALNVMGNIPGMEHARAVKCDRCMSVMLAGIIVREFKECI